MEGPPPASHPQPDRAPSRADTDPLATSSSLQDATPQICRICRGEGTTAEPLFFPCKCSGSIKYVHQDCLMEWLSHSQKKYCELCKTSFRFTKLYAPDMPKSLPVHVFIEYMTKHLFNDAVVFLRAALAISIWICGLPYFMRGVWSFLFWVSDDGLVSGSLLSPSHGSDAGTVSLSSSGIGLDHCPSDPLLAPTMTPVGASPAAMASSPQIGFLDFLLRLVLASIGISIRPDSHLGSHAANAGNSTPSSLLSEVGLIRRLTGNSTFHRTVVWVLEGQLITILVILTFILVILVRDYVVQQQPDINMRAAFAAPENAQEVEVPQPAEPEAAPANDEQQAQPADVGSDDETLDDGDGGRLVQWRNDGTGPAPTNQDPASASVAESSIRSDRAELGSDEGFEARLASLGQDEPDGSEKRASVKEYLRIYRRADGDPLQILRIAEEEGLQDKLDYWMDVTRRSLREKDSDEVHNSDGSSSAQQSSSGSWMKLNLDDGRNNSELNTPARQSPQLPGPDSHSHEQDFIGKGKERAGVRQHHEDTSPNGESSAAAATPRPRARSDGPQHQQSNNPLGNNSWTFAELPPAASSSGAGDGQQVDLAPVDQMPESSQARTFEPNFLALEEEPALERPDANAQPRSTDSDEERSAPEAVIADTTDQPAAADAAVTNEPAQAPEARPDGFVNRVADFMWGDVQVPVFLAEQAEELDAEENNGEGEWADVPDDDSEVDEQDPEAAAAIAALDPEALDAEAIDDMDDFEGVMELIGMRGPIAGLFQNAIFCAVLVTVTIFVCIFIPYNIGRISVWILANPMRLVRVLLELSKLLQDVAMMIGGSLSWGAICIVDMFTAVVGGSLAAQVVSARKGAWDIFLAASVRVAEYLSMGFPISASEMQNFSAISHDGLNTVKGQIGGFLSCITDGIAYLFSASLLHMARDASNSFYPSMDVVKENSGHIVSLLLSPSAWVIDLKDTERVPAIDPSLANWSGADRSWAILAGYVTVFLMGAMYLKRGAPFSPGGIVHQWEAGIIDLLHQASGIMKVILIISIEMLVFPLYCGLLLDAALLPLFENATFHSRWLFTANYPLTSVFVHWFVGTGYMFHFALFVSMCRKIMRPGVLYFIRDPDDPEFHPVRDVLERSLTTQLRKILFSAFVYGALVIVCLGGVVWGLSYTLPGVLPVHYSSNEPVLEFPVDLLFYNFLMPLGVKVAKPSDGLHSMYTWWFRKCARALRLTYFLFGERQIDEEGTLHLSEESSYADMPSYRTLLLELSKKNEVIPKTWQDTFEGGDAKPNTPKTGSEMRVMRRNKAHLVETGQLVRDGRFVRAPASDRVKIPKGKKIFLTVTERDHRNDDRPDDSANPASHYQVVYIPPNFRLRIFLFVLFIWLFAAITGVAFTIIPLSFGRMIFKGLIPTHIRTNDIYAFSIGIYLLGSVSYSTFHFHSIKAKAQQWLASAWGEVVQGEAGQRIASLGVRALKLIYAYSFLLVVFPLLLSTMLELYIAIPLHTYMHPPSMAAAANPDKAGNAEEATRHTVRVIQAWTLGLLYLKLGAKTITSLFPESRPAVAVRMVLRRGWLRPNIRILTRAFIIPGLVIAAFAIFGPPAITTALIRQGVFASGLPVAIQAAEDLRIALIYRKSYPMAALAAILIRNVFLMVKAINLSAARVRDEAYLIGERLHNFGGLPARGKGAKDAWRAGGTRL